MRCELVHAVRGRTRLRVDEPEVFRFDLASLLAWLGSQPGVRDVRANPACRSVVVTHDPDGVQPEELVARLAGLDRRRLREVPHPATRPRPAGGDSFVGLPLALSTAAAFSALGGGSVVAPWLLAGAAVPV